VGRHGHRRPGGAARVRARRHDDARTPARVGGCRGGAGRDAHDVPRAVPAGCGRRDHGRRHGARGLRGPGPVREGRRRRRERRAVRGRHPRRPARHGAVRQRRAGGHGRRRAVGGVVRALAGRRAGAGSRPAAAGLRADAVSRTPRAPAPPGALGVAAEPGELMTYLADLQTWLDARRADLDRLDAAARRSAVEGVTADVVLALTLWQAVRTRADELVAAWDSGRADAVDRERMSPLVWGRLGGDPATSLLSLVDAARLCDAQADQLAARLSFDPHAADVAARLRAVSAGVVRAEDAAL